MIRSTCALFLVTSLVTACPDADPISTASDTTSPSPTATSASTGDSPTTTGDPTETSESSGGSSGDDDTAASTSTGDETTGEPACEPSMVVRCDDLLELPSFCAAIDQLADDAGVKDPYAQIVVDMCESGRDVCSVCFNLANYCAQVGTNCGGTEALRDRCLCAADAFGVT